MTINKRKKAVRYRGTAWHGGGSKKKRRGKGSRGGKGMAGIWKHKKIWLLKHHPDHFYNTRRLKSKDNGNVINLKNLESLVISSGDKQIDLNKIGYNKLLGTGNINIPINVTISKASKTAIEKIENAGGSVELS